VCGALTLGHHRVCAAANVEEAELESKGALCPDAQILQHEPEAGFAVEVVETTSVDGIHADKIARVV